MSALYEEKAPKKIWNSGMNTEHRNHLQKNSVEVLTVYFLFPSILIFLLLTEVKTKNAQETFLHIFSIFSL